MAMTIEQRERKNAQARARRAAIAARKSINGGVNPATKLPHTPTFLRAA